MRQGDSFYSTLVRLKGNCLLVCRRGRFWFLFHIGAIKSDHDKSKYKRLFWFLFHIGAIKSGWPAGFRFLDFGFYSTLVRLKGPGTTLQGFKHTAVSIPHWCD